MIKQKGKSIGTDTNLLYRKNDPPRCACKAEAWWVLLISIIPSLLQRTLYVMPANSQFEVRLLLLISTAVLVSCVNEPFFP